jgi:hypothetical protein
MVRDFWPSTVQPRSLRARTAAPGMASFTYPTFSSVNCHNKTATTLYAALVPPTTVFALCQSLKSRTRQPRA